METLGGGKMVRTMWKFGATGGGDRSRRRRGRVSTLANGKFPTLTVLTRATQTISFFRRLVFLMFRNKSATCMSSLLVK